MLNNENNTQFIAHGNKPLHESVKKLKNSESLTSKNKNSTDTLRASLIKAGK